MIHFGCASSQATRSAYLSKKYREENPFHVLLNGIQSNDTTEIKRALSLGLNINGLYSVKLKDQYIELTPLHLAVYYKRPLAVKYLLKHGANPNYNKDIPYQYTPLHLAVRISSDTIVRYLLEAGADPNLQSEDGNTPLHIAVSSSQPDIQIIHLLIDYGADINKENKDQYTPVDLTIINKNFIILGKFF